MATATQDKLEQQIAARRTQIFTDQYAMSIGEMLNIYRDGEIDIHPEFQRWFRWSSIQKSRLIESILLGIPIPPIFVAQREDGKWDVVDGLQRLSTIFQFTGILRDPEDNPVEPLTLERTHYLPALEGVVWEDEQEPARALKSAQRLDFKRAKLNLIIVESESDPNTKYELFQRLNTGGAQLSDQELRNCILVMMNRDFYHLIENLAEASDFKSCVPLTERQVEEQYALELVLRFLVLVGATEDELRDVVDVGEFLTEGMLALIGNEHGPDDWQPMVDAFSETFAALAPVLGDDSFRKWNPDQERFMGAFSISAFEVVAIGIGHNLLDGHQIPRGDELRERIQEVWEHPVYQTNSGSGIRASSRLPRLIPLGRELFRSGG